MALSSLGCRIAKNSACISGRKKLEGKRYHSWLPWRNCKSVHDISKQLNSVTRSCKGGWYDMVLPYTKTIEVGACQIWSVEVFLSSEQQKRKVRVIACLKRPDHMAQWKARMERHSLHAEHHRFAKVLWSDGTERRFERRRCTKNMPWPLGAQHCRWPEGDLGVSVLKVWPATLPTHVTRIMVTCKIYTVGKNASKKQHRNHDILYLLWKTIESN